LATQLLAFNTAIDILELAPGGVIKYIYPLKDSAKIIGYNILTDPTRNKDAYKAIQKKQLFYAGPLLLKQGGIGIVARLAVFRNNQFWGFTAVVIRMETLWKIAGIDNSGKRGYHFQVSKVNPDTNKEEFFISNPNKIVTDFPVAVNLGNAEWIISATPTFANEKYWDIVSFFIIGFLFSALGGFFVYTVVIRPQKLDQLVKMRTAALQESEEKYRHLFELASDGVIVYSYDGTIYQFNKAAYSAVGYGREEFARLNLKDILLEEKVSVEQARLELLASGKSARFSRDLCKKNGEIMHADISVTMLPDKTLLAFVRDSTVRINAERALAESEQKFSRVFQSDLLSLAIYNDQGKLIDANDSYAKLLETSRENILNNNSHDTKLLNKVVIEKRNAINETIERHLEKNGRLENFEIEIETNDRQVICLRLSIEPLELNDQKHWLNTVFDITEKKNAELSLVYSEKKYRSLIEQASDGIVITNFAGIIIEVNQSICIMSGYAVEEMMGRHLGNFLPKIDIEELPLRIEELVQGKALLYERRLQKKDGSIIDVEVNSKMAAGDTLIGFVRDITERKKSDLALKKSNERFELVARASMDVIWDHDFITNETTGNQNFYDLFGFSAGVDKVYPILSSARLHPDEKQDLLKHLENVIAGNAPLITEEYRFKIVDGTYRNLYNRAYIVYDEDGLPVRMVGVVQDITERTNDRQKLLKEKELSDSIINSLPAIFYLYNKEGKFLRWNKNFETVTGYSEEEISGLHPLDLFDEEEKLLLEQKIKNVFLVGQDNVEANFLLKNKQKVPYYFSGMKIDYEGEICLMGFGLNFSDKVKSDKLIKESEQKFRSLVEQASDGVTILSSEGFPLYVSPSVERILGYTESQIMQLSAFSLAHPDDNAVMAKAFEQVMQNPGVPVKGHISRVLHKDTTWRWLEITITNLLNVPFINGIVENFRDVTEELQYEKKIMTEKELSDSIINSLPGIFYLYDKSGKFIRWNKNFEALS
ncbi:MAG: PAS domain S-box protein, partial [Ferruginibacter sp.]